MSLNGHFQKLKCFCQFSKVTTKRTAKNREVQITLNKILEEKEKEKEKKTPSVPFVFVARQKMLQICKS